MLRFVNVYWWLICACFSLISPFFFFFSLLHLCGKEKLALHNYSFFKHYFSPFFSSSGNTNRRAVGVAITEGVKKCISGKEAKDGGWGGKRKSNDR